MKIRHYLLTLTFILSTGFPVVADSELESKTESLLSLMPWPQQVEKSHGVFVVKEDFFVSFHGFSSSRLSKSRQRLFTRIEKQTGLLIDAGLPDDNRQPAGKGLNVYIKQGQADSVQRVDSDESYQLTVTSDQIELRAESPLGVLRGMETLLQLITRSDAGKTTLPTVSINDYPRFKWRGVLLDPARHFLPLEVVKRQLDGLAAAKFNVLHLHLTDDQGWRIESKLFPLLHERGSDGLYYSQDDVREIVRYAYDRGIRVIPEIDMPGHVTALAAAYPEYIATPDGYPETYQIERQWGIHKPSLNPVDEKVYEFIDQLVEEMARLFPDPYFHIGGDEVDPEFWDNSLAIQQFIEKYELVNSKGLQAYFNQRVEEILQRHGKKMVGWDEIHHPSLSQDIVIQSWRGYDSLSKVVKEGGQGVLSTGFYVDQPQPAAYHYRNDPNPEFRQLSDEIKAGEFWQSWVFEITRLRGAPVKGSFTLVGEPSGKQRGFIDFDGKSRRQLKAIETIKGMTRFSVDTWMGELQPTFSQSEISFSGVARVANGQYQMQGDKLVGSDIKDSAPPSGYLLSALDPPSQQGVLGAEAALWGENVIADVIDLRLWPRAFAIGERLWSAREINNEQDMYRRLARMSEWAEKSVGMQHKKQARDGMLRLSGGMNIQPLVVLAEAVEQAQYYHRHHAKARAGNYHQTESLNRFVDTLPPESHRVRHLSQMIQEWLKDREDQRMKAEIVEILSTWRANHTRVRGLIKANPELEQIAPTADSVRDVAALGLSLVDCIGSGKKLKPEQVEKATETLQLAMQIRAEIVVSSAYAVEKLLYAAY